MWQLSTPVTNPPPQLPWLQEHHLNPKENAIMRFYCLSSDKVHTIICLAFYCVRFIGPACRYLLASHSSGSIHLLNPLTQNQIHVPFVNVVGNLDYIGPDPIEGCDVVIISGTKHSFDIEWYIRPKRMALWQPKADHWVYVEGVGNGANSFNMAQYFNNDKDTGITNVIDIVTKKLAYQVAPPEGTNPRKGYTVMVGLGGKVLRLFMHDKVDIHCLYFDDGEGKSCWEQITDIGNQMLFLQNRRGLSFCANNFTGFKGNCIYFFKNGSNLCRYNIGDGTTEVLPCPFYLVGAWFVSSMV